MNCSGAIERLKTSLRLSDETAETKQASATSRLLLAIAILFAVFAAADASAQEPSATDIDSLLATPISGAAKYEQTARQAPGDVTIVTADEIRDYGYRNLAEVLQTVRGFYVTNDRNYSYIGVRGFGRPSDYNNRILLLIDGHTMNENVYGSAQIGSELPIDFSVVERIEIIRGPSSALYGTGGMLATVNVILKSGGTVNGGVAVGEAGSYGRSGGSIAAGKELPSGVQLLGSAFLSRVDGQDLFYPEYAGTPSGGVAHGLDFEKSYGGILSAKFAGFHLIGLQTVRQKGIPTAPFGIQFDHFAETTDRHSFLELQHQADLTSDLVLNTRVYASYYGYKGLYPYDSPLFDGDINNSWGGEVQARWDPTPTNRLTAGGEYRKDTRADYHWSEGTDGSSLNQPLHVLSAYLQDEYQVTPNVALTGGLRYDRYSTGQSHASPRLALVWNVTPRSTLKLLYGNAYRVPSVNESSTQDRPLKPEEIDSIEATWQQKVSEGLLASVSFHQSQMRNLIDEVIDPDTLSGVVYRNRETVRARGFELELTARLSGAVSGYLSYVDQSAVDTVRDPDETGSLALSNSPDRSVKAGLSLPLAAGTRASAEAVWETGRLTVQDTRTRAFVLGNLNLEYAPAGLPVRLSLRIRNIFNSQWATPGGNEHLQAEIPQNGRDATVRLEYRF